MKKLPSKLDVANGSTWVPPVIAKAVNELIDVVGELLDVNAAQLNDLIEERTEEVGLSPSDFLLHWESGVLEGAAGDVEPPQLIKAQRAMHRSVEARREEGNEGEFKKSNGLEQRGARLDLNEMNGLIWMIYSMMSTASGREKFECEHDYDTHELVLEGTTRTIRIDRDGRVTGLTPETRYLVHYEKGVPGNEDDPIVVAPV